MTTFPNGGGPLSRLSSTRMSDSCRAAVVDEVHRIQDLIYGSGDEILMDLCERMLDRLDELAAVGTEERNE